MKSEINADIGFSFVLTPEILEVIGTELQDIGESETIETLLTIIKSRIAKVACGGK